MDAARILIVDDDPALLKALTAALRLRMPEVAVDVCDSALSALRCVPQADYDAIVSDIKMPGMDGLALLSEIRGLRPEIPTLLITGHGQHDLAVQALRGGAFDFIQKPIDRDYLVASLRRAVRVRQLARQVEAQQAALERHNAELESTVAERTRALQAADRAKDDFLAMLGHELRNPVAAILNAVEVMNCYEQDAPIQQECRDIVRSQSLQMSRLLDDLLDVARITRNRVELRKQPLDLATVVLGAVRTASPMIESRGHELSVSLPDDALPLEGDAARLEQVLVNLLNNAARYTDPGGRIWLSAGLVDHELVLEVVDTGVGIAPDMLSRIFAPFTQASHTLDRSRGGLGIGLTLVQRITELHGGTVQAFSDGPGRGSRFVLRLPALKGGAGNAGRRKPAEAPAAASSPDLAVFPLPPPAGAAPAVAPGQRVLLVEDHPSVASMTATLLANAGHEVVVAHDAAAALQAAADRVPDVILVDIGLPGMDGFELARHLRADPRLRHVLLVAVTGYGQPQDHLRSQEVGFDHHLVKPVAIDTLEGLFARASRLVAAAKDA